jgi:hypothetical protein
MNAPSIFISLLCNLNSKSLFFLRGVAWQLKTWPEKVKVGQCIVNVPWYLANILENHFCMIWRFRSLRHAMKNVLSYTYELWLFKAYIHIEGYKSNYNSKRYFDFTVAFDMLASSAAFIIYTNVLRQKKGSPYIQHMYKYMYINHISIRQRIQTYRIETSV